MSRYKTNITDCISRQAAIDAVNRLSLGETDAVMLSMRISDYLKRLPSAQPEVVQIVFCKDCRHFDPETLYCPVIGPFVWHDFFCAYGEKVTE